MRALGTCRALKNLWLKGNKLTGRIPDSVALLPELEYLDVHANELSGSLPRDWDAPKLKIFRGEDNEISGQLPASLLRQPDLEQVFLHNNRLRGPLPVRFGGRDTRGIVGAHEREILGQHDEPRADGSGLGDQASSLGEIHRDVGRARHLHGRDAVAFLSHP